MSEVSLGTWQVGGRWGEPFNSQSADAILQAAMDGGVNFIDTADVYSDGLSEEAVGRAIRQRSERIFVATKCGRRSSPHTAAGYDLSNITRFAEDSLRRLGLEVIDLLQLHCPPREVLQSEQAFDALRSLQAAGKIRHFGVSVETVDEACAAIERDGVASVQIIFNMMRHKPAEDFFSRAAVKGVGVIARVPLASGLLTGKFRSDSTFGEGDHRHFNRHGEVFDRGETFSGVNYQLGLKLVDEHYLPLLGREHLAAAALRWVLMFPEVSTVIPGASSADQVAKNLEAAELPPLSPEVMQRIEEIYDAHLRSEIHDLW